MPGTSNQGNHCRLVRFGLFEIDFYAGEAHKAGIRLKIGGQAFQVLEALLERPGEVVTRDDLRHRLWADNTFVDYDLALKKAINRLRDVLGDSAEKPRYIETIPRRGYRFIGEIEAVPQGAAPAAEEKPTPDNPPIVIQAEVTPWFARAPRRAIAAALALLVVALVLFGLNVENLRGRIFAKSRATGIRSIAVLPLVNLSSDANQEYFSDGMTDELITELAKFRNLRVISHTSVDRYKQTQRTLPEIAHELGVDAVVEGRVIRSGDRVRITAQLIDGRSDQHLWAQSYERDFRDILSLQAEVARRIAAHVGVSLTAGELEQLPAARSVDPLAHEAYLKGDFYWNRLTCKNFKKSLEYFSEATTREPGFAQAHSGMADAFFSIGDWTCGPQEEAFARSKAAALKALELEPRLAPPHTILGELAFTRDWDWAEAEENYREAVKLDRNDAGAHASYALFLCAQGRGEEALSEMTQAHELDPTSEVTNVLVTYLFYLDHQFDRALEQAHKTLELYPQSASTYYWMGQIYERMGMEREAGEAYTRDFGGPPNNETVSSREAFQKSGLRGFWVKKFEFDRQRQGSTAALQCWQTLWYAHVGDTEQTLKGLDYGFAHHCDGLQFLATEPIYDKFRSEPRFQELLARMKLPMIRFSN